jgi:alkylation response protein AidB-like acyl-CoA dehydrogenase
VDVDPFLQDPPRRTNRFRNDAALRRVLERTLGPEAFSEAGPGLDAFGERTVEELPALADRAEATPPRHVPFDGWGRRVDRIDVDPAWTDLVRVGQEAGVVALAYERPYGPLSRVVQFGLLDLYDPVSATADCPLSMTDAAARVLLDEDPALAERYVPRLVSRGPGAWTSGQWMTEKEGGSDVGRSGTTARHVGDGTWTLRGTKWFTSATTADVALALARPEGAEEGSRGLSLFLVELRRPDGSWNGISVRRLKDKLGTKALPTAELDLVDTVAHPVGELGRGVAKIAAMLNVTRVHAAVGSVAGLGDGLMLARDYARRREAFGRPLHELPIHRAWMASIAAEYEALLCLTFRAAHLLGAAEDGDADPLLARVTMPLTKMLVARRGVDLGSELVESFGGAGYLEDTGLPRLLRDLQVQSIWEGTTSVLAADVLRALSKPGTAEAFATDVEERLASTDHPLLVDSAARVKRALARLVTEAPSLDEGRGRRFAWGMAQTYAAALLCEQAAWSLDKLGDARPASAARIYTARPLVGDDPGVADDDLAALAFD